MLFQKFAGLLAGFLYSTYASTFRYEVEFEDENDRSVFYNSLSLKYPDPQRNLIYACFHQDDLGCLPFFSKNNICILISQSKDGQILASAVEYMGYQTIRGSSHRGGVAGLLAGMKKVFEGYHLTIAVDGPKGPIYKVKDGITAISQKSKRPIVPIRSFPLKKYVFEKSWNKATLPFPFTKIKLIVGKIDHYNTTSLEEKLMKLKTEKSELP